MKLIILVSLLIAILAGIFALFVFKIIKRKIKGDELHLKKNLSFLGTVLIIMGSLIVYDSYLAFSLIRDNKDTILDQGKSVISGTVEFGATAVFEGLGKTFDHFENKWDTEYERKLKNVEVEINEVSRKSINEKEDEVFIDVILINNNSQNDELDLNYISRNNYILIGDTKELYYPLSIDNHQYSNMLPTGKTVLKFKGIAPKEMEIRYFRLMNLKKEISINLK